MRKMGGRGYLFVYGTLKVGGYLSAVFDDYRLNVTQAAIPGTMYNLGSFPGITSDGGDFVFGELHYMKNFSAVVKICDQIEGYRGKQDENNLYHRKTVEIEINNKKIKALVYVINEQRIPLKNEEIIKNGFWNNQ